MASLSASPSALSSSANSVTRVLVLGSGALGSFFASRLSTLPHVSVSVVCRSNYPVVKRNNGFTVTSPTFGESFFSPKHIFNLSALHDASAASHSWDYILIATKVLPERDGDPSLPLTHLIDSTKTCIVVMQNGLGVERPFRTRFPHSPIVSAVTRTSCEQPTPGHIKHNHWTRTTLGPYLNHASPTQPPDPHLEATGTERTTHFATLLEQAGFPDVFPLTATNMSFARWHKTAINCAINPTSVLADGPTNRTLASDPETHAHMLGVMREVLHCAEQSLQSPVPPDLPTPEDTLDNASQDTSGSRVSMWLDWKEDRPMEIEAILGEPLREARRLGVEMPKLQSLYAMLRVKQMKRDGEVE